MPMQGVLQNWRPGCTDGIPAVAQMASDAKDSAVMDALLNIPV